MGVVIANFSKIEARLKALYVRFWGIPEGGLKALQIKGFIGATNSYYRNSQNPCKIYQITLGKKSTAVVVNFKKLKEKRK